MQMQMHMFLGRYDKCLYIAINKNDEQIFATTYKLDKTMAIGILDKATRIIESLSPPERISERKDFYKCKFCDFSAICHDGKNMNKNCRTCRHSTPADDGKWHCGKFNEIISDTDYGENCVAYEAIT
jgi:hypothetical protein